MGFKYKNKKKNPMDMDGNQKIRIRFDKNMLRLFIGYLTIESRFITRANYVNMQKLFDIIDLEIYVNDEEMYNMIEFVFLLLKARLKEGLKSKNVVLSYCMKSNNDNFDKIFKEIDQYCKIKDTEIRYISKAVIDRLKYAYIVFFKDIVYREFERIDTGEYDSFEEINGNMKVILSNLLSRMRKAESLITLDTFSLADEVFDSVVTDIVNKLKDPSRIFKTGIRALNKILSPGFQSGRLYLFLGLTGGFKSGILLSIAKWMKYYNSGVKAKRKPGARPTILFITTENDVAETVARLFNMVASNRRIEEFTPEEVINMLKTEGKMTLTDENNIDIIIKYFNDREIDTNDLYSIIEEIEDDNREVISLILDYIKRIRAAESGKGDERIELKNSSNELKSLAQNFDIPVISAMQINRAGNATVEAAMEQNKDDLAKFIGRTNVANCWDLVENSDWVCIINIEKKRNTNEYYLTFKRTKIRYKDLSDMSYFNHPFADGDRIRLIDDLYLKTSISEESLGSDFDGVTNINGKKGRANARKREDVSKEENESLGNVLDFKKFALNKAS